MSDKIKDLTDQEFDEVIDSGITLVDFWAPWCGPCQMQAPILDRVADDMANEHIKICKINVEDYQNMAVRFNVRSIPTLLIFKDGVIIQQLVGAHPEAKVKAALEAAMVD